MSTVLSTVLPGARGGRAARGDDGGAADGARCAQPLRGQALILTGGGSAWPGPASDKRTELVGALERLGATVHFDESDAEHDRAAWSACSGQPGISRLRILANHGKASFDAATELVWSARALGIEADVVTPDWIGDVDASGLDIDPTKVRVTARPPGQAVRMARPDRRCGRPVRTGGADGAWFSREANGRDGRMRGARACGSALMPWEKDGVHARWRPRASVRADGAADARAAAASPWPRVRAADARRPCTRPAGRRRRCSPFVRRARTMCAADAPARARAPLAAANTLRRTPRTCSTRPLPHAASKPSGLSHSQLRITLTRRSANGSADSPVCSVRRVAVCRLARAGPGARAHGAFARGVRSVPAPACARQTRRSREPRRPASRVGPRCRARGRGVGSP